MRPPQPTAADLARAMQAHVPGFRTKGAWILLATIVLGDLALILGSVVFGELRGLKGALVGLLTVPVSVVLVRRQRPEWAIHLLLGTIWSVVAWLTLTGPGVYGASAVFFVILPVLGGLFCGVTGVWTWSGMAVVGLLSITVAHGVGALPEPLTVLPGPFPRARTLLVLTGIVIGATIGFLHLHKTALGTLVTALDALRAENAERERAEQAARVAAETRARFLATMSHELRTPLNGVVCAARLLEEARDETQRQELSHTLVDSAEGLLVLINNVLDWSQLQHGTLELRSDPVAVRRLLRQTTGGLGLIARQKGIALRVSVDDAVPSHIRADAARLGQVLTNLVGNAVKFTETGEVTVHLTCVQEQLHIRVADTGVGFDLSDDTVREALFSPFSQADTGADRHFEGSGLGLAITRELVQSMAGRIDVTSKPGEGATFVVVLPCIAASAPQAPLVPASTPADARPPIRVLIVEDNAVNLQLQTLLLEQLGHTVTGVESGGDAVEAVFSGDFDLVLMDRQMPGIDGLTATRLIRGGPPRSARQWIVGLSADARPEARQEALAAGMDGYLTKPLQLEAFEEELARYEAAGKTGEAPR